MNYTARKSFENIGERISPYGGELVNLLVQGEERRELAEHANKILVLTTISPFLV